jgi:hypothetical protein
VNGQVNGDDITSQVTSAATDSGFLVQNADAQVEYTGGDVTVSSASTMAVTLIVMFAAFFLVL